MIPLQTLERVETDLSTAREKHKKNTSTVTELSTAREKHKKNTSTVTELSTAREKHKRTHQQSQS